MITLFRRSYSTDDLLKTLKEESESAVKWFRENKMIVNPDKFEAIVLRKGSKINKTNITLNNENITINTSKSVKILEMTIGNKLNFKEDISVLCKKTSLQLNAISRLQKYMGKKEKEAITNSFVYSNLNYCPLVWHFCENKNVVLELY